MKLNWGTGIAIFYTFFVVMMVGMVVYSKNFDHSLVVDNYYEEDLQYQQHIDRVNNAKTLASDLSIESSKDGGTVVFQFPDGFGSLDGQIWFYRADDKSKDFTLDISPDSNGRVMVPVSKLEPGRWQLKVNWQGDGKPFYKEQVIMI